jgi:monoamine oxidase
MAGLASEVDVAVVGAGAAGIAAARRLAAEAGRTSYIVLEARERPGGRAWTMAPAGFPLDLGCEWLHSADRNVLTPLAERLGFSLYRRQPDWLTRLSRSGVSAADEADWLREREAHYWAIRRAAQGPDDMPASAVLRPGGRWNALFDATSTWGNAVELESLSVKDNDRYEDSGINFRLREGYGRLFATLAEGLPIAYAAPVSRIAHDGKRIALATKRGTVTASRVIVTVPTDVIAGGHLAFDPPLADKMAAAAGLPLGLANKLFLRFDGELPGIDHDAHLVGSTTRRETMSYQVRPFGRPVIACFFGGRFAAQLERDGIAAMTAVAADELAGLFGADIRRQLSPLASSAWRADPFARGSYSYARPGHADDRTLLAGPVDDRLFFAGEATSANFFSTAHGAYQSGTAAAAAAAAALTGAWRAYRRREAAGQPSVRPPPTLANKVIAFGLRPCAGETMKSLRVLVVEDDALIAMLLGELLARMGHDVCATAATETDAVTAAIRHGPDLMIIDAGLAQGSGVSAMEQIQRAGPLAHVFVSGDADRVRMLSPGALVVRKPFRQAELIIAIDAALAAVAPAKS